MWKRRICWFVLIFIAVVLYIFVNGPMALSLLVGACILPFISMFFLLLVRNNVHINMPEPVTVTKGDKKAERRVEFINSSFLPKKKKRIELFLISEVKEEILLKQM